MKLLKMIEHFLLPPVCTFCRNVCTTESYICEKCSKEIKLDPKFTVPINSRKSPLTCCMSAFPYHDVLIKNGIMNFKFHNYGDAAKFFAKMISLMDYPGMDSVDVVTAVPLTYFRRNGRGYNQSELLAKSLCKIIDKPYMELLKKKRNNKVQSTITDPKLRKKNVEGCYVIRNESYVKGKKILLIDDVYTTGSTMNECAKTLKENGAKMVIGATIAYAK